MALTITTLNLLNQYIGGVMQRADHHGQNVNEVVLTLAGAVIWRATQDVEVKTYKDAMANILWLTIGANRYALAYNHQTSSIELRERTQQGNVVASFSNQTTAAEVKRIFIGL